jgi:hypothetical protein
MSLNIIYVDPCILNFQLNISCVKAYSHTRVYDINQINKSIIYFFWMNEKILSYVSKVLQCNLVIHPKLHGYFLNTKTSTA